MEHPLPNPRAWRTATIVATAIAGVELVLLLGAGFLLLGKSLIPSVEAAAVREAKAPKAAKVARRTPPAAVEPAKPEPAVPKLSRDRTFVLVLNGNGVTGAARIAAQLVNARGYKISDVGDAERADYARSVVMYRPGFRGDAVRFARELNVPIVTALDGLKPKALEGAQLAYVIGAG